MTPTEIAANALTTISIWLAARNSVHTWWSGIVGCALFGYVFAGAQLYADASLQGFFIATSISGWWNWVHSGPGNASGVRAISYATRQSIAWFSVAAIFLCVIYGGLLYRFTNAYLPFVDASVLALSAMAQCLLMQRRLQTWPVWLAVNTISVPLFASRGLMLTAFLYAAYWCNAWYGWYRWRAEFSLAQDAERPLPPASS
jgi:nicotinamide mononucleotide transporter